MEELQSEASRCLEYTRSQVMDSLRYENSEQIDSEHLSQQQIVDDIRFKEMDNYIHQQIEADRNTLMSP